MNKYLSFLILMSLTICLTAQNQVQFNIEHKLASEPFELNKTAENNIKTPFRFTRLEYYISEITLVHDGGQETPITDLYILVNASVPTSVDLGQQNITNLEKVRFHIGVDPGHNNGDPSTYKNDHPLALKNPSMHWGWASGYNIIALEGLGGTDQDMIFQIHAFGNENYSEITIDTRTSSINGRINIDLQGDYTRALEDIDAGIGLIYHGTAKYAKDLIGNFDEAVFSFSGTHASTSTQLANSLFNINPSISSDGLFYAHTQGMNSGTGNIVVNDISGKFISKQVVMNNTTEINLKSNGPGTYLVSLWINGKLSASRKLLVN